MKTDQIICCVVALILGMLLANMLKNVCGCKVVEGHVPVTACRGVTGGNISDFDAECKNCWDKKFAEALSG